MRVRRLSDERGIALAVAVFALVVIGALVAGTYYAGRIEQQTGRNTMYAAQAAEAAEAGLHDAIGGQSAGSLLALQDRPRQLRRPGLAHRRHGGGQREGYPPDSLARRQPVPGALRRAAGAVPTARCSPRARWAS